MKSKSERETNSEVGNVNHCEIRPHVLEKIDKHANLGSGKYRVWCLQEEIYIYFFTFSLKEYINI